MIAVKEKIKNVQEEIEAWKKEHPEQVGDSDEILPETFFKLKYPDNLLAQKQASTVVVTQAHLLQSLEQVVPSISMAELERYEELRNKYSCNN